MTKSICILGRQPEFGIAELESVLGPDKLEVFSDSSVICSFDHLDFPLSRFGGITKVGHLLTVIDGSTWDSALTYLNSELPKVIEETIPAGKIRFGISTYGWSLSGSEVVMAANNIKKVLKQSGRSVRFVPNVSAELSSAQVFHNKLDKSGGFELLVIKSDKKIAIAKTIVIQDIEAYSARDQARPKRDARVGMIPPKLAQIMINIANPPADSVILDPFCGSGVVLQEALLMGYGAFGSDISERMAEYSKVNLVWLSKGHPGLPEWKLGLGDAMTMRWETKIGGVVSELYLGKPLFKEMTKFELEAQAGEINTLLKNFLLNLAGQVSSGTKLCLALPAWKLGDGFYRLPLLEKLEKIGYNLLSFKTTNAKDLTYHRPGQLVARQIVLIKRS
ncbi:MAG TPA: DNA methyltransferase [Candidatus Saccharimonadales bacterium]|nr:DNA methyltransferase [Candidatus Saccharimonadales bacterium]